MKDLKLYSTDEEYLQALKRKRKEIAGGEPFNFYDDTTIGNKSTTCSWGLTHHDLERYGFSSYRGKGQHCPLRHKVTPSGCFWNCKVHQAGGGVRKMDRETALALFDKMISDLEANSVQA
jgi:hypothetical protein